MHSKILQKFKKYMLFLSTMFFLLIGSHLMYMYLTEDADLEAIQGGNISETIIGSFPHFNPLLPSNDHNAYINNLLFRSLIKYNPKTQSFEGDLADCSIENLAYIECILKENIFWSDENPITPDDILATYDVIQTTKVNQHYASILENTLVKANGNIISFTNNTKDINILSLLTQSLLPKKIIETLNAESVEGKLSDTNGIFSGMFQVSNIFLEDSTGITRITLEKNTSYQNNPIYVDYLIINLFQDEQHFLKNKNTPYNIMYDKNQLIGNTIPRLQMHTFTIPQFTAQFFNTQTLDTDLRVYLQSKSSRENIIKNLGEERVIPVYNPFFSEQIIDTLPANTFSLAKYMQKKGYYRPSDLLAIIEKKEASLVEEKLFAEKKETQTKIVQEDVKIIQSPTQKKYNFVSEDNILLQGVVGENVDAVYIDDYELQGFTPGDTKFYYRLSKGFDSIQDGENNYTIYFEIDGEKVKQEEIYYYLNENSAELQEFQDNFFTAAETLELEDSQISTIDIQLSKETIASLDANAYYSPQGEKFQIRMIVSQTDVLMSQTSEILKESYENNGIGVDIQTLSLGEITQKLRTNELEYDVILLGINLGHFHANIYSYLHSDQVENGFNISNFSTLALDILLEKLKTNILESNDQKETEKKILDILSQNTLMQTLYTNKHFMLIDRNVFQHKTFPPALIETHGRQFILEEIYFSQKQKINWESKSFRGAANFILSKLF